MYLGAKLCCTAAPRLLIFPSLDGTISVRLKLCCTAAPRLLVLSSLDGSNCVRLKLCCTAVPRLIIFVSLDDSSCVRLKLCYTAAPSLLIFGRSPSAASRYSGTASGAAGPVASCDSSGEVARGILYRITAEQGGAAR